MEKVLSQEEIDALLAGLDSGKIDITPEEKGEIEARSFDFKNYVISTRLKIPGIDVINDHLARSLRISFSTLLREIVDLTNIPTQMERFKDFMNKIPVPTSIHVFKLEPLKGNVLLIIDAPLVFVFVERFLGGGERKIIKVEGREFTPIEQRLIKRVVDMIFIELEKAWKNIYPVKAKYIRGEVNPQFARVLQPEETVIVTGFTVDLESLSGKILFCYSLSALQPIKEKLYSPYQIEEVIDVKWKRALEQVILGSQVTLKAFLGKGQITLGDLLHLEVGDVIVLERKIEEPVEILIEDTPKILGRLGVYRGHLALKIDNFITSEQE
ncbi:MAG: flagellar motor switch protein FliM [Caldimicrobium sp.]|nr:flagellar motor switch protein FliM [Caldimicrobium sp.]MCX7874095.1 flagellar motor switch protein FliM [Caldimicrobium sp.]MDW8093770.1 flagellar motor switch protein FliM [Caldimicrobium sp.]